MIAKATVHLAALLFATSVIGLSVRAEAPSQAKPISALTHPAPGNEIVVSFVRPGRVVELVVKEGDHVKKDQLLARQDDSEEAKAADYYKSKAFDDTQEKAQELIWEQSTKDYKHLNENMAASAYEKEHADLQVKIDAAKINIAKKTNEQDHYEYERNLAIVEKTKLFSPIDGIVEELYIHQGESVDSQSMKVVKIVNTDPMSADVQVPFAQAEELKEGDTATITLSNKATVTGHVVHIAQVADTASDTLLVRVEAPNPSHRKLGERVTVAFNPGAGVASNQP